MAWNGRLSIAGGHRFINLAFVCALGILIIIAAFSYVSISNFIAREDEVAQSYHVITKTKDVFVQMLNAETGARGYLLTSRENFLEPYVTAKHKLPRALNALERALVSRPAQHDLFIKLQTAAERRLVVINSMLILQRRAAAARVQDQLWMGKRVMDSIREVVATMNASETALLVRRAEESNRNANQAIGVILLGNVTSFGL